MKKALLLFIISVSLGCVSIAPSEDLSSVSKLTYARLFCHKVKEKALYFGASGAFGLASLWARLGWGISILVPHTGSENGFSQECLLISDLLATSAKHLFLEVFKTPLPSPLSGIPPCELSWHINKINLSQIPALTLEQHKLLHFLEKRYLAKSTGFFSSLVHWICPCFGIEMQVHPETTHSYARNLSMGLSLSYRRQVDAWKARLPYPSHFPLLLTRPSDLKDYLPSYAKLQKGDLPQIAQREGYRIFDVTDVFSHSTQTWQATWQTFSDELSTLLKNEKLDASQCLCVQRLQEEGIGALQLLPLRDTSSETLKKQQQFLLEWLSDFGLSANRIELDRTSIEPGIEKRDAPGEMRLIRKTLNVPLLKIKTTHPQKALMIEATFKLLEGLFDSISASGWKEIENCPTKSGVVNLSLTKIEEELNSIQQEKEDALFFDTASKIEQIHAHLTALLEVFSPFHASDFDPIYRSLLTSIPKNLKPLTSCALHTSAMTSLAGILKATEEMIGKPPQILFGENTYYECIRAAKRLSSAKPIEEATESDLKEVDILVVQFHPVLRRIDDLSTEYRVEKISETLQQLLSMREGKPLVVALDCTLDFINSPKAEELLKEFQKEIEMGTLNIISYRSGLKFDLFGMDNYCGAPLYMIHSQDEKWAPFERLLTDPVLLTDLLSVNWFCLAYRCAADELELYRKQIFDNTRALLRKIPKALLSSGKKSYRVAPVEEGANPAFIDIKVTGPFHKIRASALVGGVLYTECMEGGHPIFYRPSLGFYHPNYTILFTENCSTIRLTLGLDPSQIDLLANCFEKLSSL